MNAKFLVYHFIGVLFLMQLTIAKSMTQLTGYPECCRRAALDENLFSKWRCNRECQRIVETVSYKQGLAMEAKIKMSYPYFLSFMGKICQEDTVGSPVSYQYSVGRCSPTTLRYVKTAGDLHALFGDLSKLHIVEIGGGFGGQCKILHDTIGFASYTIVDLPECVGLIEKYLKTFNIANVYVIDYRQMEKRKYDLIISNYAVSEIDQQSQLNYVDMLINLAARGYIMYNFSSSAREVRSFTLQEFVLHISIKDRTIKIERENPITNPIHVAPSFLVTWGSDSK